MRKKLIFSSLVGTLLIVGSAGTAFASQQVFHFISPAFGGNPLNGSFLMSMATGQGFGVKSGQGVPDLSGLNSALSNLGTNLGSAGSTGTSVASPIIIIPSTTGTTTTTSTGTTIP